MIGTSGSLGPADYLSLAEQIKLLSAEGDWPFTRLIGIGNTVFTITRHSHSHAAM